MCNYSCRNERYGRDFHSDGLCMSGIGTIRLRSHLKEEDIIYANYENDKVNYHTIPILLCEVSFDYCTMIFTLTVSVCIVLLKLQKYKVPFSICIDESTIVVSVRGTLSLKDALTDMSASMERVKEEYCIKQIPSNKQYIHMVYTIPVCVCVCVCAIELFSSICSYILQLHNSYSPRI